MSNNLKISFGIDFGTTKSGVAFYIHDNGKLVRCGDLDGAPLTSSVAINRSTGEVVVGSAAKTKRIEWGEQASYIHSVKMNMDNKNWYIEVCGVKKYVEDIASEVFLALKREAMSQYNYDIDSAIVAIPVGFSPEKREKIRQAARKAGIEIKTFISEPTAAFFANYKELKNAETVAVFDWGGGTLDFCVLRNDHGKVAELASKSLALAGDNIDEKLAKMIHKNVVPDIRFEDIPEIDRIHILDRAERTKCLFLSKNEAQCRVPRYISDDITVSEFIKYGTFSALIEPEIKEALNCLKETIEESKLNFTNIDKILLVGGSCNLRPLQEILVKEYGKELAEKIFFPDEPEWCVAEGAAILADKGGRYYTNQSVGVILADGNYFEILPKDTPIAQWKNEVRFAVTDQSAEARFIFSGSADIDKISERYNLFRVEACGFLLEQIVLNAMIDNDLIFRVSAYSTFKKAIKYENWWKYSNLKYYYKI